MVRPINIWGEVVEYFARKWFKKAELEERLIKIARREELLAGKGGVMRGRTDLSIAHFIEGEEFQRTPYE
jgi:hypothetical protein